MLASLVTHPSSLYWLHFFFALTAFLHLYGTHHQTRQLAWPFKPIPVLLLLLYLLLLPDKTFYSWLIATGLFFSIIGDLFLLKEERFFIQGLVAFLMAHLFYIGAFSSGVGWAWQYIWILVPLIAFVVIVFRRIQDQLRSLTLPVLVYMGVIVVMVWRASARPLALAEGDADAWWGALGAISFMISDTLLALHKFDRPLQHRTLLVMITYYLGQLFIARSAF